MTDSSEDIPGRKGELKCVSPCEIRDALIDRVAQALRTVLAASLVPTWSPRLGAPPCEFSALFARFGPVGRAGREFYLRRLSSSGPAGSNVNGEISRPAPPGMELHGGLCSLCVYCLGGHYDSLGLP